VSGPKPDTPIGGVLKAGIGVDNWKLPVFRRRLAEAGYEYADAGSIGGDATLLTVKTTDVLALKKLLERCQAECREMKR
jgi:hypothetical protein